MTNCINCGAPLHGDKCEYCGTEYRDNPEQEASQLCKKICKDTKNPYKMSAFPAIGWINYPSAVTPIGAINSNLQNNDII